MNDLEGLGKRIDENERVSKILRSLTPEWMTKRAILEEIKPKDLNELIGGLKAHEMAMKQAKRAKEEEKNNKKTMVLMASNSTHQRQ